jgi:glycosyltransferase involved in cell wall biosynthesis
MDTLGRDGKQLSVETAYDLARAGAATPGDLPASRRLLRRWRAALVGTDAAPGVARALAGRGAERPWLRWTAAARGRADGWRRREPPGRPGGRRPGQPGGHVLVAGCVPPGAGGMRDYGELLAAELGRFGFDAGVRWVERPASGGARGVLRANRELLRVAEGGPPPAAAVWNYTPAPLAVLGVPGPGVLLGRRLRRRGVRVVVVLHELAQPFGRAGIRSRLAWFAQVAALVPVVAAADAVVATTESRARWIAPMARVLRARVAFVPVFANFAVGGDVDGAGLAGDEDFVVAVVDHGAEQAAVADVTGAVADIAGHGRVRLVLLGAPDRGSGSTARWLDAAAGAGLADVEATGVVTPDRYSAWLRRADVVVLPNRQGPSSRKGTLAAALAHGCAVVAVDGLLRWERLVAADAVLLAPPTRAGIAGALRRLRDDPSLRAAYADRARDFYGREQSLPRVAGDIGALVGR